MSTIQLQVQQIKQNTKICKSNQLFFLVKIEHRQHQMLKVRHFTSTNGKQLEEHVNF